MRTPGRPVEFAGYAPFHSNRNAVHLDGLEEGRSKIVVIFFGTRLRNDARIHEGGQKEIGDHKQCDHSLKDDYGYIVFAL